MNEEGTAQFNASLKRSVRVPGTRKIDSRLLLCLCLWVAAISWSRAGDSAKNTVIPASAPAADVLTALGAKGVTFSVNYTGEVLGDVSGGYRQGATYDGLLQVGVQIDLEKLTGWKGASFFTSVLYPHGESLTDRYVHGFSRVSSIDANHDPRLYEVWFQQNFEDGRFSMRIGQFLADDDFYVTNYGAVFVNSAFSAIPIVTANLSVPTFPVAAPGARLCYAPNDSLYALIGIFTADAGNQYTANRHGTRFFEGSSGELLMGETGYTFNPPPSPPSGGDGKQQAPTARPLSGTYKLGGCYDTGHFPGLNGVMQHSGNYALYAVANQEVWHEPGDPDQGLRLFGQIGAAPDDRNAVSFYCDGGVNYQGLIPSRDKDLLGLGLSYTKISGDLLSAAGIPVPSHHETIIEATYKIVLNDNLSVQPDFQYIFNPGATGRLPGATVLGLRFNLSY